MTDVLSCAGCGNAIDLCEFCEDDDCEVAICYMCLILGLGEAKPTLRELEA